MSVDDRPASSYLCVVGKTCLRGTSKRGHVKGGRAAELSRVDANRGEPFI